jgi:sialate O-acetylesterase
VKFSKLDVWVLAGQSNMEGCGELNEAEKPHPSIFCFDTSMKWRVAKDPLHDLLASVAPIDQALRWNSTPEAIRKEGVESYKRYWKQRHKNIGAGLGISFAKEILKHTKRPIGLIACAHGGTSMDLWSPEKKSEGLKSLYGAMLERIKLAGGNLKGVLWYQGESDTFPGGSQMFEEKMTKWVAAVRRDTGMANLPVITVQIGCVADAKRNPTEWEAIRRIQSEMPKKIKHFEVVNAIDLDLVDSIHIDAAGLKRLGKRMARVALKVTSVKSKMSTGLKIKSFKTRSLKNGMGEIDLTFTGVTGTLLPLRSIKGFSIHHGDGSEHSQNRISAAFRHAKKKNVITLRVTSPIHAGDAICYGRGLMPVCNVVDEKDMSLGATTLFI